MDQICGFPYFDPEFDSLSENTPPLGVCFDNETCDDCTLVKVDSANRHGILLEMVQVLADAGLIITKSYISSDGGWLMDVFHVTDHNGRKLTNYDLKHYISHSLAAQQHTAPPATSPFEATVEIVAADRPSLLPSVTSALLHLSYDVEFCKLWTHHGRSACILHISDRATGSDPAARLCLVEQLLGNGHHFRLLGPNAGRIHTERRLHQLLQEDESPDQDSFGCDEEWGPPQASIESLKERDYSVVNVRSKDRPKLLFDTVCALTDLDYDVFHASLSSYESLVVQEYYVRRMDGCTVDDEMERLSVVRCLVSALERRISHGKKIELKTAYRDGLLSETSRVLSEHGMYVDKADFARQGERAVGEFYVKGVAGGAVDMRRVEAAIREIQGEEAESSKMFINNGMWSHVELFSGSVGSIQS